MTSAPNTDTSSARPEHLHRYQHELVGRHVLATRVLRHVRSALATYEGSCPDVPIPSAPLDALAITLGDLRGFAAKVSEVGAAFELADGRSTGALSVATDAALARVLSDRFPQLATTSLLGSPATDMAEQVADRLERASRDERSELAQVRASVPAGLSTDPAFARIVLRRLGPDHLARLTRTIADRTTPGSGSPDLGWLADLFALGSADGDGRSTELTHTLLSSRAGRNTIRILRAASTAPLVPGVLEDVAVALVQHPARVDRPPTYSPSVAFLDAGDTAVLLNAAHTPGIARRVLTGPDPDEPVWGRTSAFIEQRAGTDQRGVAALLEAARHDPATIAPDGSLTGAGLALVFNTMTGVSRVGHSGARSEHLSDEVLMVATRIVIEQPERLAHHTVSSEPTIAQAQLDDLVSALHHLCESPERVALLADGLEAARHRAQVIALEEGDTFDLELVGRMHTALEQAAERADVPRRPFDPVVDVAGEAVLLGLSHAFGAKGAALGQQPVEALADAASDRLAEEQGTAAAQLARQMAAGRRMALLLVDHPPPGVLIAWPEFGLVSRAELEALGEGERDQLLLQAWVRVQDPAVHEALDRLGEAYRRGRHETR